MSYEFFLSYTRANNDAFLKKFFDELSQAIRDIRGLPREAVVGFFDQQDIELGEDWDQAIVQALQTSAVFLAVASPGYFKSVYCGKEWALFRSRLEATKLPSLPPLIKPVIWIPFAIDSLSATVRKDQLTFGDPQAIQNQRGFKHLLKNLQEHEITFNNLIESLANEITAAADKHRVSPLATVPRLGGVVSAFSTSGAAGRGVDQKTPTGPKHVRFVYIAADPNAFGNARDRDAYVDCGGPDWKPYYPDDVTRIHRLVQNFVSNDDLDFTSEELPFTDDLVKEVEDAWLKRQIVVLIVDGWTVHWNVQYRNVLERLDNRLDFNWCVLVPYNEKDPDAAKVRAEIDAVVGRTFYRHAKLAPNPLFYRDNIRTAADLKKNLRDVLTKLKEEIKKHATVDMPVPAGPSRAVVSGPAAQG